MNWLRGGLVSAALGGCAMIIASLAESPAPSRTTAGSEAATQTERGLGKRNVPRREPSIRAAPRQEQAASENDREPTRAPAELVPGVRRADSRDQSLRAATAFWGNRLSKADHVPDQIAPD